MMRQYFNVVHQAVQLPLPSTLVFPDSVNRLSRLLPRWLPNTSSTVEKLREVPGIGLLTAPRCGPRAGSAAVFKNGRDLVAWHHRHYETRAQAMREITEYIDIFSNRQ